MPNPDNSLENLSKIYTEFGDFTRKHGKASEADTRVKIIDKILTDVLCWPESSIIREKHAPVGFIDYVLASNKKNHAVVEAKREGIYFELPTTFTNRKKYKISGAISTCKEIKSAIEQAQAYCNDYGIQYGIVTNGYSWLLFKAVRHDKPWRDGDLLVFPSAKSIKENFTDFWNTFSFPAITNGQLDSLFLPLLAEPRQLIRPIDLLTNPDATLLRNKLHAQLSPFIEGVFRDIGIEGQIEILENCYVYFKHLQINDQDLGLIIEDSIPKFLIVDGGMDINTGVKDSGIFGKTVEAIKEQGKEKILLLLGGIGAGKTTFLNRFFKYANKDFIDQNTFWFYIHFLGAPPNKDHIENFINEKILEQLRERYADFKLESKENLEKAYQDKIKQKLEIFSNLEQKEIDKKISNYLEKWSEDLLDYIPRILKLSKNFSRTNIICIDNVDQLSPEYQAQIFLLAQRIARNLDSIVIVAMREESYYSANIQRAFTAYNNRKFHILSPSFTSLISKRILYCKKVLELPEEELAKKLKTSIKIDKVSINKFLNIIEKSIFSKNKKIASFIEALSFGNMREALEMFATFLYSGATNVDKMIKIYDRGGNYTVAFHEFAKSIILNDRKYYKESQSKVLNLFDCSNDLNSSHFVTHRILALLISRGNENSPEGRGFVDINKLYALFLDIFNNEQDLNRALTKLLIKQLIQLDTRSTESLKGANYIKISSAGWWYYKYLANTFAYLDLVFVDTPFNDHSVAEYLHKSIIELDEFSDKYENVNEKLDLRFKRVDTFLEYLNKEEEKEFVTFELNTKGIFTKKFIPEIIENYQREKEFIQTKIKEKAVKNLDFDFTIGDEEILKDVMLEQLLEGYIEKDDNQETTL